jgi:DNA-binding CsgD family transcriptional regulator
MLLRGADSVGPAYVACLRGAYALAMPAQIFGRDAELQVIDAFLDSLPSFPGALVLAGPAGAGKTTLLRAGAAAAAGRGFTVLGTSPAPSDLRLAFAGLADLLESCLDTVASELPAPQARALRVASLLDEAPPHPPDPRLIAAAFRAALAVLARSVPVIVVIDDVQWLDPPSGTSAGFAVRRLEHEPVGVLLAQRTDHPGADLPLELDRARMRVDLLPVGALSLGALHRMLRERLDVSFSHPTLRRIEAGSGGNPFIALEIGRALARRGIASTGNAVLPVPDTLSGLVDERLGELPPAVLEVVRLVAVMPDEPAGHYLTAGARGSDLDAAVVAGVLEDDSRRLRFSHPLLASAVAGAIPPARLRELHAAAAVVVRRPEARARHQALAASGPSATVAAGLDAAARVAAARGAPATAAELFELAASLTPGDAQADAIRRRLDAAGQFSVAGENRAARATLASLIESTGPGPARAEALSQLAALHEDDFAAATSLLQQALTEAGGDQARSADIHFNLSESWMQRGDQVRAGAEARLAVADAERAGDTALLASCIAQAFLADLLSGADVDERELERALELERTTGSSQLRTSPIQVAAGFYIMQGRLDDAETVLRRALARAEAEGIELWRHEALLRLSRVAGRGGDTRRAADLAATALEIAEQLDLPRPIIAGLYVCASNALLLGDAGKVRDLTRRGLELAQRAGDRPYVVCWQALLGSLDLALGDYQAAVSRLGPLTRSLPEIGWHAPAQTIAPDVVEALIAAGELEEASAFLTEVEHGMPDPLTSSLTTRCRGALAAAGGDLHAAVGKLTEALRLHDQISPHPMERGRTLLVLGVVQRRLKQRAAARATLSEALGIFERIDARLWAEQARDELGRISGRAAASDELTATELRVAELVASGRSNKEVAAELFVTVRAVESTLTKAYAKLGVRSRTELAARLNAVNRSV